MSKINDLDDQFKSDPYFVELHKTIRKAMGKDFTPARVVKVMDLINQDVEETGGRIIKADNARYWFVNEAKEFFVCDEMGHRPSPEFQRYLLRRYGIQHGPAKILHTQLSPKDVAVRNVAYFDKDEYTDGPHHEEHCGNLYLSRFGEGVIKINTFGIELIDNGEEEFFLEPPTALGKPPPVEALTEIPLDADPRKHVLRTELIDKLNIDGTGAMTVEQQRIILHLWLYAVAFPELLKHGRPILIFEGSPGSGKTTVARVLQDVILGEARAVTVLKQDAFMVNLRHNFLCLFDNVDNHVVWFPNDLAATVTGSDVSSRLLHTNGGHHTMSSNAFPIITTATPKFARSDVADRSVIIRLKRHTTFLSGAGLGVDRTETYQEWLSGLCAIMRNFSLRDHSAYNRKTVTRLADFELVATDIGTTLKYTRKELAEMWAAMAEDRSVFAADNDSMIDFVERWCDVTHAEKREEGINPAKKWSSGDLHNAFSNFSDDGLRGAGGFKYPLGSPTTLGTRLSDPLFKAGLLQRGIVLAVTEYKGSNKSNRYTFTRPESPESMTIE